MIKYSCLQIRSLGLVLVGLILHIVGGEAWGDDAIAVYPLNLDAKQDVGFTVASLRDPSGYLWIATDDGLQRYDGYQLKRYRYSSDDPTTIGSRNISSMLLDSQQVFWSAGNVLNRYDPLSDSFQRYTIPHYDPAFNLIEGADHNIWVFNRKLRCYRFHQQTGQFDTIEFDNSVGQGILAVAQAVDPKYIWLLTDKALLRLNTFTKVVEVSYDVKQPLNTPYSTLVQEKSGHIWLAASDKLVRFDLAAESFTDFTPSLTRIIPNILISTIALKPPGILLVGTEKQGMLMLDTSTEEVRQISASDNDSLRLPVARVNHIFSDWEGTSWITSGETGVYYFNESLQKFKTFQRSVGHTNSLIFDNVLQMIEDRKGDIWIATDGGGLDRFNPNTHQFTHYKHDVNNRNTLSSDSVISLAEDSQGNIWAGTWAAGLNRLNPDTGEVERIARDASRPANKTLAGDDIFAIQVDSRDRLLMSLGVNGLQMYDPASGQFQSYNRRSNPNMLNDFVNVLLPVSDDEYWVGGDNGLELLSLRRGEIQRFDVALGTVVYDLHRDDTGILWIASADGLVKYNPANENVAHFRAKHGLSDIKVLGIEEDIYGKLWLSTKAGLNRFDTITKRIEIFDQTDGLAGNQFNRFSHAKSRSGIMYFGGKQGFSSFDPAHIPRNEFAPNIHLLALEVNYQPFAETKLVQSNGPLPGLRNLVLSNSVQQLKFTFVATGLLNPEGNKYKYRLLGRSEKWIDVPGNVRSVEFTNLPAGKYTLQIIASNSDGVWVGSPREIELELAPQWWESWWSFPIYGVGLLLFAYLFSVVRMRLIRRQQQMLRRIVTEKTRELREASQEILQLNSELEQRVQQRTEDLSREIEERKGSETKMRFIAYHDTLTRQYNREWLLEHITELIERDKKQSFALVYIGGDHFRYINDLYGHDVGDQVLMQMSRRINSCAEKEGMHVCRMGSDEFCILIDEVSDSEAVKVLSQNIINACSPMFEIDMVRLQISVSVGYVVSSLKTESAKQMIRYANIAMHRAKANGRAGYLEFDEKVLQDTLDLNALETDLKSALRLNQFEVVFQPITDCTSHIVIACEILLRWKHPTRGYIPPDKFIPIAEALGLIFDIGLWVFEQACLQVQHWERSCEISPVPRVSVNLSTLQVEHPELLNQFSDVVKRTGIRPDNLKLEITESVFLNKSKYSDVTLDKLCMLGFELAIDDFGTGYSSLSYLSRLPATYLKIDRSFINELFVDNVLINKNAEIVRTIIRLAHDLDLTVIAEGVETKEQLETLKAMRCDLIQGYYISRPVSNVEVTKFILEYNKQRQ